MREFYIFTLFIGKMFRICSVKSTKIRLGKLIYVELAFSNYVSIRARKKFVWWDDVPP